MFFFIFKKNRLLIEIIIILVCAIVYFLFKFILENISNISKTKTRKNKTKRKVRKHDKKTENKKIKGRFHKNCQDGRDFCNVAVLGDNTDVLIVLKGFFSIRSVSKHFFSIYLW